MLCGEEDDIESDTSGGTPTTSQQEPKPGLYIETRNGELVHASLSSSSLGFQLGETLQIMSRGKFLATPHAVKAPSQSKIGRASLAVFLQPLADQILPPLNDNAGSDKQGHKDRFSLERRWRPTFGAFQKATTETFN